MNHKHITSLVSFNVNLQLAHWQANTLSSEHRTLGKLYDEMVGLTDEFAEITFGRDKNIDFDAESIALTPKANISELLNAGIAVLLEIRSDGGLGADQENTIADMEKAINRTKYLLKAYETENQQ